MDIVMGLFSLCILKYENQFNKMPVYVKDIAFEFLWASN